MTLLLCTVGVMMIGMSGWLVAHVAFGGRTRVKLHLSQVANYGFQVPAGGALEGPPQQPLREALERAATTVGRRVGRAVPILQMVSWRELSAAGFYTVSPELVHGARLAGTIGLGLLMLLLLMAGGAGSVALEPVLVAASVLLAWWGSRTMITGRGRRRLEAMDRGLPELIDLLISTVEVGMGFTAALDLVSPRVAGPLGDELRLAIHQQSLGVSTERALEEMLARCDTASIRAFTRTISRAETMGTSVGPILRDLATDMRRRQRLAARERIQKTPVKMIFPLMFLIFPALLIELIYPAAYSVLHNLSGI